MNPDFFFWWSVVSTVIGIGLLCISIWQTLEAKNAAKRSIAQVKIWMQEANGLQIGLTRIVQDNLDKRYSTTSDIANAIWTLQSSAFSLYQSLYEERSITEEEYKQQQRELLTELKKRQSVGNVSVSASASKSIKPIR